MRMDEEKETNQEPSNDGEVRIFSDYSRIILGFFLNFSWSLSTYRRKNYLMTSSMYRPYLIGLLSAQK